MYVFVDFDGVLRRDSSPRSGLDADCVEHFAGAVLAAPEARVVIASTWRLVHPLSALRALFPQALGERIVGVTPTVHDAEEYEREHEVRAWLGKRNQHAARWVAVDDVAELYRPGAPLVLVDPASGFDEACARQLRDHLGPR